MGGLVHTPVAVHMVRVVHGQCGDLLVVLPAVREPLDPGEVGEQPVRLGHGLPRRIDEALLGCRPAGLVLLALRRLQRPLAQRTVPLDTFGELPLGSLWVPVVQGHGPVVLGSEAPLQTPAALRPPSTPGKNGRHGNDGHNDHDQSDDQAC